MAQDASINLAVGSPDEGRSVSKPRVPSALLGTALFVLSEVMFFSGLISSFVVIRSHADVWPPEGQPRLPILITGINTAVLLFSAYTMWRTRRDLVGGNREQSRQWLQATFLLGLTFVGIQGYEWAQLISHGLGTENNLYGGLFYVLIGMHAAHVIGALIALGLVLRRMGKGCYSAESHDGLLAMRFFWFFVVAIWPLLYAMVYLWEAPS